MGRGGGKNHLAIQEVSEMRKEDSCLFLELSKILKISFLKHYRMISNLLNFIIRLNMTGPREILLMVT